MDKNVDDVSPTSSASQEDNEPGMYVMMTNFIAALTMMTFQLQLVFGNLFCSFLWKSNRNIRCTGKFMCQANIKQVLQLVFVWVILKWTYYVGGHTFT